MIGIVWIADLDKLDNSSQLLRRTQVDGRTTVDGAVTARSQRRADRPAQWPSGGSLMSIFTVLHPPCSGSFRGGKLVPAMNRDRRPSLARADGGDQLPIGSGHVGQVICTR